MDLGLFPIISKHAGCRKISDHFYPSLMLNDHRDKSLLLYTALWHHMLSICAFDLTGYFYFISIMG